MPPTVHSALAPVRHRQRLLNAVGGTVFGLFAGSAAGVAAALTEWGLTGAVSAWVAAVIAAGPVLGLLAGLAWRRPWGHAAAAVDGHYHLKDRSATALDFTAKVPIAATPTTLVVDRTGHIAGAVFGAVTYPELTAILAKVA